MAEPSTSMETRDWRERGRWIADLLKRRTGDDIEVWNARIRDAGLSDEPSLRTWLDEQGVTGYPQSMLVMERFGYPDWIVASADDLIEGQYRDRPELRPILDALLVRASATGDVIVQPCKTYVSLMTPKRTFAAVRPTTRQRVGLGLKLPGQPLTGRFLDAGVIGSGVVNVRIPLTSVEEVDDEVGEWLAKAYRANV
jgi:hypothetical protein